MNALVGRFPLFASYMCPQATMQPQISEYLRWYRSAKIINRLPNTLAPPVDLESFDSRYMRTEAFDNKNCFVLWVDGMGIEWMALLVECLQSLNLDASVTSDVVTSVRPTETRFNKQWETQAFPYTKLSKLDVLAHKGMPDDKDYYSCIDYQLSVISEVAQQAADSLQDYDHVLITGDHGSSRLAALAFHDSTNFGVEPPKNAVVRSHGRYCQLPTQCDHTALLSCQLPVKYEETEFLVMKNYQHFKQSGNAAGGNDDDNAIVGEVHGGTTPEEYLVPLVVVSRNKPLPSIDYELEQSAVYRSGGDVSIVLLFTEPR